MKDTIEKAVKDLGAVSINNLISTEESINPFGLYPADYDPVTGLFLCHESERHFINKKQGGTYAKKKSRNNHGNTGNH